MTLVTIYLSTVCESGQTMGEYIIWNWSYFIYSSN